MLEGSPRRVNVATRILVVDDDPLVRRSVERILDRAGYEVSTAANVEEAVRAADQHTIDAALVDFALAEEDGLTVLARLRELQPGCLRILMTGRTDFPMVVEAVNRGEVLRVVRKPFEGRQLIETLQDGFASMKRMAQVATAQQNAVDQQERQMFEECLTGHMLRLALQPIVSPRHGFQPVAYEALLRSSHGVLNGPLPIVRVAERTKRIDDLGREVFRLAAARLSQLPPNAHLFVNLHPEQLADPAILSDSIAPLGADAGRIVIEITERSRLNDIDGWESSIDTLTRLGFALAIDDLGAGYNSLAMLADLQPRYIKLDMSLTRNIDDDPRKQRLVQLLITFADATGAALIAEGVETAAEADILAQLGTHLMQGYHFGRPQLEIAAAAK